MNLNEFPFPEAFIEKVVRMFGENAAQSILASFCMEKSPSIRINTLKSSVEEVKRIFSSLNILVEDVPWYENALIVKDKTTRELTELEIYTKGFFYIQSLSSMIPVLVLDPQKDEKILDIAAAPGSKTTQLAAQMLNTGEIIANDVSRVRMYKLEENIKHLGVTNTQTRIGLGEKIWQDYPEYFDKTLVDVPCSMEGRFHCNDKKSFGHWSPKKVKQIAKQQQWLLRSAISATKPGGTIVYSTCTLSPEENESVIDWILTKEAQTVALEDVAINYLPKNEPITMWNAKIYNAELNKTLRINPSAHMEGFYVAKLKKLQSNVRI